MELKSVAEDVKKGFERLLNLLKSITFIKKEKKEEIVEEEEESDMETQDMEKVDELTSELAKMRSEFETIKASHETEVKGLKEQIAAFEKEKADAVKAKMEADWEILKKTTIPPGLLKDEATLKSEFETDPHAFIMRMVTFERKEERGAEGSEFETEMNELDKIEKEMKEAMGVN